MPASRLAVQAGQQLSPHGGSQQIGGSVTTNKLLLRLTIGAALAAGVAYSLRPRPVPVEAATVSRGPLVVSVDERGITRAHDQYVVTAPVAGRLTRIELHEGDAVKRQQPLASLTPLPLSPREREEQQARLAAAQAQQREALQHLKRAQSYWQQAQRERQRQEQLAGQGFISAQQLDQLRNAEDAAAREHAAARFRAESAAAEVRLAQAALQGSTAGQLPLLAPIAGRVLAINEKSERVVAAAAPILTLGDPGQLEVAIDVLSSEAVQIRPGMPVWLSDWGGAGELRARVRTVEPLAQTKVSALGVEEQRVNVIADLIDPPQRLGHGYRVQARIVTWQNEVLKIPLSALFRCGNAWCVFRLEQGRAQQQPVSIGLRSNDEAEIRTGLRAGEQIARHPSASLTDGVRIRVTQR